MELTKQERKLAEVAAKNYHHLFYRKSETIGWIGVPIFALGVLPLFSWPSWLDILLSTAGFALIISSCFGVAMSALGKLYEKTNGLDRHSKKNNIEG